MIRTLIIMVKQPRAGRVKTRLAAAIGPVRAVSFYRNASCAVIHRLAQDPRWRTVLAVTPDTALSARDWSHNFKQIRQGTGDLGDKMRSAFAAVPPGPAVLVGSDIPGIRASHIAHAFNKLKSSDAVFGPANDGGYWLVGFARQAPAEKAFQNVRWSSEHALADTEANLADCSIARACTLTDVDNPDELDSVTPWFGRFVLPPL